MSLFAEIAGVGDPPARSVREAVAADVGRICASRRGTLLLAPEYGVDDVTLLFHSYPQIDAWIAALGRSLGRYEPRLRGVEVVAMPVDDPTDLTLRVEIRASLVVGGRAVPARFTATLDPACRMSVR